MVRDEQRAVTARCKVFANGRTGAGQDEQCRRLAIEAQDFVDHAQEGRAHEVAALAEQRVEVGRVVLEPAELVLDREAHRRRLRFDVELGKQACQQRIIARVEDDEAGVDLMFLTVLPDRMRVRVTA